MSCALQADKDDEEAEVECRRQLLLVLAEVTLDGSTPPICTPLFATLFCQAASGAVPVTPQTKVRTARCFATRQRPSLCLPWHIIRCKVLATILAFQLCLLLPQKITWPGFPSWGQLQQGQNSAM